MVVLLLFCGKIVYTFNFCVCQMAGEGDDGPFYLAIQGEDNLLAFLIEAYLQGALTLQEFIIALDNFFLIED